MDGMIGEIKLFSGSYAPRSWAFCHGQLMSISSNMALFAVIGTTYGGDGRTTFALPDLRGRVPIGAGTGPNLSQYNLGQQVGVEAVNLTVEQIPYHNHVIKASNTPGDEKSPAGGVLAASGDSPMYSSKPADSSMSPTSISDTGGGQSHTNIQPSLALNYIIAIEGIFPPRG